MSAKHPTVAAVLDAAGRTFATDAEITLRDTPSPLYRLLVLATLLAKPIDSDLATAGARELGAAGLRTPKAMLHATWQQRVDALGRAHYRRFDESSATILGEQAQQLIDDHGGDLRRIARDEDVDATTERLTALPGIGPAGAAIFLREAQQVWPWLVPYVDDRTVDGARRLGFDAGKSSVRRLVKQADDPARLAAAFVRVTVDHDLTERLTA